MFCFGSMRFVDFNKIFFKQLPCLILKTVTNKDLSQIIPVIFFFTGMDISRKMFVALPPVDAENNSNKTYQVM